MGTKGASAKKYDRVAGTMDRSDEYDMAADDEDKAKAETEVIEDYAFSMQLSNQNAICSSNNYSNNSKSSTNSNRK